jgi:hypothetical protein
METLQRTQVSRNLDSKELVGKMVVDPYGWTIGRIVGVTANSVDSGSYVGVEDGKGGFTRYDYSDVRFVQNNVVIGDSWKTKTEDLSSRVVLVTKKISALDELGKEMEFASTCDEMRGKLENEKKGLLEERRCLGEQLKDRMKVIDSQLRATYGFMACVKIDYALGSITEETYQRSNAPLHMMLDRLLSEKDDIKFALDGLTNNLSALPPEPLKTLMPSTPKLSLQQPGPIKLRISEGQNL